MKVDLYTKAVFTVIALCLVYMVAKDISSVPTAHAQQNMVNVNIQRIGGEQIFRDGEINHFDEDKRPYLPVKMR
ncbi:MAG: hypothetical protein Q8R76_00415 [Candidatus Omnitrophota bacterium]|nr:hypothetical protein [Candidatus Omnitrophota bacterium]